MNCVQSQLSRYRFAMNDRVFFTRQDGATLFADDGFQSSPAPSESELLEYDTITTLTAGEPSRTIISRNKELYSLCIPRLLHNYDGQTDVNFEVNLPAGSRFLPVKNISPFVQVHHVLNASIPGCVIFCEVFPDLDMIESATDLTAEAESRVGLQISQEASLAIESKGVQEPINQIIELAQSTYQSLSKIHIDFYGDPEFSEWRKFRFCFSVTDDPVQILFEEKRFKKLLRKIIDDNMRELLTLSYNFE